MPDSTNLHGATNALPNRPAGFAATAAEGVCVRLEMDCSLSNLGGKWVEFDPTGMAPLEHLARLAHGRDAKDVVFATTFGPAQMVAMSPEIRVGPRVDILPFEVQNYAAPRQNGKGA